MHTATRTEKMCRHENVQEVRYAEVCTMYQCYSCHAFTRLDGPAACVYVAGQDTEIWMWNDRMHRLDGEALITLTSSSPEACQSRQRQWWVGGVEYTEDTFANAVQSYCKKYPRCPTVKRYQKQRRVKPVLAARRAPSTASVQVAMTRAHQ